MSAKEYLMQIQILDIKIQQKQDQLLDLKNRAVSISSPVADDVRVQTTKSGDTIGGKVTSYVALEEQIEQMILDFSILRNDIINEIHQLNDVRYITLLYKRYVEYKRLELISVEMNYDYEYIRQLHGIALLEFEKKVLKK